MALTNFQNGKRMYGCFVKTDGGNQAISLPKARFANSFHEEDSVSDTSSNWPIDRRNCHDRACSIILHGAVGKEWTLA